MARRRQPPVPELVDGVEFPAALRRGVVVVEDFVPWSEQPPDWWGTSTADYRDHEWREIRAMRRWQAAVREWGAQRGLSDRDLRRMHVWPDRPPPFR